MPGQINFNPQSNQENITPQEKALVEKIRELKIDERGREDLLLAWKGYKPVAAIAIDIASDPHYKPTEEEYTKAIQDAEKTFKDLGLAYEDFDIKGKEKHLAHGYHIARKKEDLEAMNYIQSIDFTSQRYIDEDIAYKEGLLWGFPETACRAFANGREFRYVHDDLPNEILRNDYMAFYNFSMSKSHLQEELKFIKKRADEIKRLDPEYYNMRVKQYLEHNKKKEFYRSLKSKVNLFRKFLASRTK